MEDYKKKYEDALSRARIWKEKSGMPIDRQGILDYIFPELKKSEGEESKKWILEYLHDGLRKSDEQSKDHFRTAIAWLEKEGNSNNQNWKPSKEQINALEHFVRSIAESGYASPYDDNTKLLKSLINDLYKLLENQSGQEPADKVEPKFKVGDWITDGDLHCKITDVLDDRYIVDTKFAKRSAILFKCENNYHLWTIQDAKDGDVLASSLSIFIFKRIYMAGKPEVYCAVMDGSFIRCPEGCWTNEQYYPATREQRNILFQKMKENGYEWDDENKELKKIEINPDDLIEESCQQQADDLIDIVTEKSTWSEDDERIRKSMLNEFIHLQSKGYKFAGLESKDIITLLEKQGEQKSADKVEPEQKEEIADRNMETTEENEGNRLYYTLNWVISIYGQLDEKAKREAEELFPELKEISTLSPFERKLMELCNFCAHKGKILTAASARYAAKSFLSLAMEHKKAMEDKK